MIVTDAATLAARIVWIGIDVSKKQLDAAIWLGNKKYCSAKFDNSGQGIAKLQDWAKRHAEADAEVRFCMEATGDYHIECALFFTESGFHVSVVNPARIKYFGIELGRLNKTDKADAKLIAQYATERSPKSWPLRNKTQRSLFRLVRRRVQLVGLIGIERNRRECPVAIGEDCVKSIKVIIKALRAELRGVEAQISALIEGDPHLKENAELIRSTKVLKFASVAILLAEMPPVEDVEDASSYAAVAGGHSTSRQSGINQSQSAPMSRAGRSPVRGGLYMPTLSGLRFMPELRDLYDRLRLRGKKHRQAMVACIRKLLMIVYGLLKHRRPYKSRLTSPVCEAGT